MVFIKLTKSTAFGTPYAVHNEPTRRFILQNLGRVFPAERVNMNFYKLANGMEVHVYNAFEVQAVGRTEALIAATDMFNAGKDALKMTFEHDLEVLRQQMEKVCTRYANDLAQMGNQVDDLTKVDGFENLREFLKW